MLKWLNRKIAFQWILFLGLLAFAVYTIVTQTQVANGQGAPFLYQSFADFFSAYEFLGKGIILAILLFQITFLQYYAIKNEFAAKNSLLPVCFYLAILLLTKSLITISPLFFTLMFFLIMISINYSASSVKLKNSVFWTGLLIAFATCFDLSSLILIALVVATLLINQFFKIKEIGILLFGFTLPYFYFFSYHLLTDNYCEWIATFHQIKILGIFNKEIFSRTLILIALIFLGILYTYFIIRSRLISESKIVIQRKKNITLNIYAALMVVCLFISNTTYPYILGYLFVPLSIYLATLSKERNPLYINELTTIITFATLIVLWL